MKLQDKVAVITGGASGIGLATAKAFRANGARVVIIGRTAASVEQAAKDIGGNTVGTTADVSRLDDIDRAFEYVRENVGGIDVLFANAGILRSAAVTEVSEEHFDEVADINFKGAFFTAQRALPSLNDGGSIIFTSSTKVHFGAPGSSVYSATKAALNSLAKTMAVELAGRRIRVNVISPGPTASPLLDKMIPASAMDGAVAHISSLIPLNRLGTVEEIASGVVFLASDDSSFMTGQELLVDGGMAVR